MGSTSSFVLISLVGIIAILFLIALIMFLRRILFIHNIDNVIVEKVDEQNKHWIFVSSKGKIIAKIPMESEIDTDGDARMTVPFRCVVAILSFKQKKDKKKKSYYIKYDMAMKFFRKYFKRKSL